jgi:hypothetical protein
MRVLVQDGETGMRGRAVADWADANRVQLKFKPPGSKAWIAEIHEAILRKATHGVEMQLEKEGIFAPFEQTLATTSFMHNALVSTDGATAYNALLGRTPNLLPSIDGTSGEIDDQLARGETQLRHHARLREIATCKIVEATAKNRMRRADGTRTRPALELSKIQPGMSVDIWFDPSHNDAKG